jgi:hypothetical protein
LRGDIGTDREALDAEGIDIAGFSDHAKTVESFREDLAKGI